MNEITIIGAFLITFALVLFGYGINSLQRFKVVSKGVLWFVFGGLVLDISAIACMANDLTEFTFTVHNSIGLSALLGMVITFIWLLKFYKTHGAETEVNKALFIFASVAHGWWVLSYLIGIILVLLK